MLIEESFWHYFQKTQISSVIWIIYVLHVIESRLVFLYLWNKWEFLEYIWVTILIRGKQLSPTVENHCSKTSTKSAKFHQSWQKVQNCCTSCFIMWLCPVMLLATPFQIAACGFFFFFCLFAFLVFVARFSFLLRFGEMRWNWEVVCQHCTHVHDWVPIKPRV